MNVDTSSKILMMSLLLLMGALAAGAGVYTLFREPEKKDGDRPPMPGGGGGSRGSEIRPGQKPSPGESPGQDPGGGEKPHIPEVEKPSDQDKGKDEQIPSLKKKKKLELSYSADEIITNNSRYSFHRRPLLNAESLVDKENFDGALEILKRVNDRIEDEDINLKIDRNIQDIENHVEGGDDQYEADDTYSDTELPIRDLVNAIKDISEAIASSLAKSFQSPFTPPPGSQFVQIPPEKLEELGLDDRKLDQILSPIVYQINLDKGLPQAPAPAEEKEESLELPEDTFFSDEWDKFKDLPLKDRRAGTDRRSGGEDRRGGQDRSKDRRQGDDRRKVDLFQEREDYLNQKAEEKREADERKRQEEQEAAEDQRIQDKIEDFIKDEPAVMDKLSDMLPEKAFQKFPIMLPEPEDRSLDHGPQIPPSEHEPLGMPEGTKAGTELPKSDLSPLGLPDPTDLEAGIAAGEKPEEKKEGVEQAPEIPSLGGAPSPEDAEAPEIEMVDGDMSPMDDTEAPEEEPEKVIHGVLELKPPEEDDAPFLTLTYDFTKIPDSFRLSKNYSVMEYGYYKYKPMLVKAQEFARRKMLKNALNYYRVIKSQNIPPELKGMINRNIKDITEFLEKFLMAKGG